MIIAEKYRKLLIWGATLLAMPISLCAAGNQSPALSDVMKDIPEIMGTAYGSDITKQEMLDHYRNAPDEVPEWLPDPYRATQAANFARNYVYQRELAMGAAKNGFAPSAEIARQYIQRKIDEMDEEQLARFNNYLKKEGITQEEYLARYSASPEIQQTAAKEEYLHKLAQQHIVTEDEIREVYEREQAEKADQRNETIGAYYVIMTKDDGTPQAKEYIDAIYEKVIAGKGENFVQLAKNYSIGEVEDTPHMFDLNSVHKSFLDRFEALKLNEISKPYQESGQWRILYRVPVPKASYKGQQWRIRIRLEKERLGDAWSSLHEESGLKLNFAVPDIGM